MADIDEQVAAEYSIRQLQARYTDSVWRQDFEAFGDCFTEECEWKIGGVTLNGRSHIVEYMRELFATKFRRLFITLRTPLLDVQQGRASGRTYMSAQNIMADGKAFAPFGVYYEHFLDQGDKWRFSWRLFQTLYAGPADLSGTFFDQEQFGPSPGMPPRDVATLDVTGLHVKR
jgi:hypothetical protein